MTFFQATRRSRIARALLLLATCAGLRGQPAGDERGLPFITSFEPADYQGHTQVWSAVADSREVLYFGNLGCVLEYDGSRWSRIAVPEGTFVRGLAVDGDDVLWIGAVDELGYAALSPTGERKFVSLRGALPPEAHSPGEIWRVYPRPDGVLFQSNGWILHWTRDHFETLKLPGPGSWQLVEVAGDYWVTSAQHGWFRLKIGPRTLALEPLPQSGGYPQTTVPVAIDLPEAHHAIVGSPKLGLLFWDGVKLTPFVTEVDALLKRSRLYRGIRLADGRLVLTTLEGGAFILDAQGRLLAHLDQNSGLADNTVGNVLADRRGGIWFCLDRGIAHADARPWLTWLGPSLGASHSNFDAPFRFGNERYVASTDGLFRITPATPGEPVRLVEVPGLKGYFNFAEPAYGGILCGTESGMLFWKDGKVTELPDDAQNVFGVVPSIHQAGRWFAMVDGQLRTYRYADGAWVAEGRIDGLEHIRSAYEDPDGTWWLGTPTDGALRVRFPQAGPMGPGRPVISPLGPEQGMPVDHGWVRIVSDHGSPLLLSSKGLFRYQATLGRFERTDEFGPDIAAGNFSVRTETEAPAGMWLAAKPPGQAELITPLTLGLGREGRWLPIDLPELAKLDDVSALRLEGATAQHEGVLWIGGHGGLVRVDVDGWRAQPPAPPAAVLLRRAEDPRGEALPLSGAWDLPHTLRGVKLVFAAPGLARDPMLRFESVLDSGSDRTVSVDLTPQRDFSALASGAYRLRVRAIGNAGIWSAPLELAFTVQPPWWLGIWAWVGYILLGFLIVVFAVRERTRELTRRAEVLEGIIAARTEELRKNNLELAHLHKLELDEKIEARLSEAKARLELLRYQLNPHFLMNAFTVLRSLVHSKPDDAANMVGKLADFCRIALTRTEADGGTVDDEAQLIETYLGAEKARWRSELAVSLRVDPAVVGLRIPPFLLQPLVENAIKYGGRTSPLPLRVQITLSPLGHDGVRIEVANTGTWVEIDAPERIDSTGIGLDNLRQRLSRYYPKAHQLTFASADGWVRVVLELTAPPRDPFQRPEALV